jgi:hypothetical protein
MIFLTILFLFGSTINSKFSFSVLPSSAQRANSIVPHAVSYGLFEIRSVSYGLFENEVCRTDCSKTKCVIRTVRKRNCSTEFAEILDIACCILNQTGRVIRQDGVWGDNVKDDPSR